jgi:hypothetical protein
LRRSGNRSAVAEDAHRWRADVVELAGRDRPQEGAQKPAGDRASRRDEQHQDAHDGRILVADQRTPTELIATIVRELSGMRIAEASGVSAPLSASVRPTAL